ncbi:MAG TPA: type II secretion system F family protein [Microbacteriaceae bacterium]|nr:type II secretion system F family protein [Microbacteriaceae bacterium]
MNARDADSAALPTLVRRVAVLLEAGVAPQAVWRFAGHGLGAAGVRSEEIAAAPPHELADAIARAGRGDPTWLALAAAWAVATASGAPLATALRAFAELLRGFADAARRAGVALAGPRATARLVVVMPLVGLVFGVALGQDSIGVLIGSPIGWVCLALGGGLLLAALAWNRALLRAAAIGDRWPGLAPELIATAMTGGASVERACAIVHTVLTRYGITPDLARVEAALAVATAAGAPVAELLRAEADEARRAAIAEAETRAERLSVTLMLPLGVCVLPAFVLLGVVPLLVAVVSSTVEVIG